MTKSSFAVASLFVLITGCGSTEPMGDDDGPDAAPGTPDAPGVTCMVGMNDTITARLAVTTDDNYKLWVNGALIDDAPRVWSEPQGYDVTILRHPARTNVIAIEPRNTQGQAGRDRGVLADLRIQVSGAQQVVVTDAQWKLSPTRVPAWETPSFVDASWPAATAFAVHGDDPWFGVFDTLAPGSTASWLWTYDPAPDQVKPDDETIFARRSFRVVDPVCAP